MRDADFLDFSDLTTRVWAARGKEITREQLNGLWMLVNDLEWPAYEESLLAVARESPYQPTPAAIHAKAADLARRQAQHFVALAPEVAAAMADGELHYTLCDDTGWEPCERDAHRVYGPSATVPAVRPCPCRHTNPVWQAKRASTRRVGSQEPGRRGRDEEAA